MDVITTLNFCFVYGYSYREILKHRKARETKIRCHGRCVPKAGSDPGLWKKHSSYSTFSNTLTDLLSAARIISRGHRGEVLLTSKDIGQLVSRAELKLALAEPSFLPHGSTNASRSRAN